ncbi:glycosyltransferase family 87 protein [Salinarchaeum chitinilyticum]
MALPGSDRPLVAQLYPVPWLLLLVPVFFGLHDVQSYFGATVAPPGIDPESAVGVNYEVYYYAVDELFAGGNFYDVSPPGESDFYEYLYPPITILLFVPTQLVSPTAGYWLFLGLNALAAVALTVFAVRYVEDLGRPLGWIDVALVFAFCYLGSQMVVNFFYGNVNLLLGAGVAAGIYLLEVGDDSARRQSVAGGLFATVALIKVFPALLGLYLLRIRAWWATASALAVGIGGLLAGELLFALGPFGWDTGDRAFGFGMTERWLREAVIPRSDTKLFMGGFPADETFYVTIQRPLSHVLWGVVPGSPEWLTTALVLGSFAIGLLVAGLALRRLPTRLDRLVGAFAAAAVAVTVVPSLQYYVALTFLPVIVLAYVLDRHPARIVFLVGGLLLAYAVWPPGVLEDLSSYPAPIQFVLDPIATTATTQLLGLAVMLLACGIVKLGYFDDDSLPEGATDARPAGPPLREWLEARGLDLPGTWDPTERWTAGTGESANE